MGTDSLYLRDAYQRSFAATVVAVDGQAVALDRTAFYPTGGGQPNDTGVDRGAAASPMCARRTASCGTSSTERRPRSAPSAQCEVDWDRRHALMRTHTALHVLCGVIWNEWRRPVTGGNMEPLSARMDFEFDPLPGGLRPRVEDLVNDELAADRADRGVVPAAGRARSSTRT